MLTLPKSQSVTSPKITIIRPGSSDADKYHITEIMAVQNVLQEVNYKP